jgi:hypothetical protein
MFQDDSSNMCPMQKTSLIAAALTAAISATGTLAFAQTAHPTIVAQTDATPQPTTSPSGTMRGKHHRGSMPAPVPSPT